MGRLLGLVCVLIALGAADARAAGLDLVAQYPTELGSTEIEVAGDMAFVVGPGGMEIVSIRDPARPERLSLLRCERTFDVALDPAVQIAAVAVDQASDCMDGEEGFVVVDIADPRRPRIVARVPMPFGAHTLTMDGRTLYANQQEETLQVRQLEIFDLGVPSAPRRLSTVAFTTHGPHDSFVRMRPDGRRLVYTANIDAATVIDASDLSAPKLLQTIHDPRINYAHAAEVSHDDQVILVSDEMLIGAPSGVCGKAPAGADIGALHFYPATADGLFAGDGVEKLGTWNVPAEVSGGETCTIHVFVQAPDQRRVVAAWYLKGTRIADFSDPANVVDLAAYEPEGAAARQAIPHNGLVYVADLERGMEVLRYTGEGWPATAGPAEAFRFGAPAPARVPPPVVGGPVLPPPAEPAGRAVFRAPRCARSVAITDARGVRLASVKLGRSCGRRVKIELTGRPGTYRWRALRGRRLFGSGRVRIRSARPGLTVPSARVVVARTRA